MSDTLMAVEFVVVVGGGVLALLFGMYMEYRQNLARIAAGTLTNANDTTGPRRVLGWGLGFGAAGIGLFVSSFAFGLPSETDSQGQGVGIVLGAVGSSMLLYVFLAARLRR